MLNSKYENFEIIVVNDGSIDNSKEVIQSYIKDKNIKFINFEKNKGKRTAIYEAIKVSTSDIIITIDSDTIIKENTILNLIQPFKDQKIGAVAGNIKINNHENIFTAMLDAAFCFGFYFLRPAQSTIGSVLCLQAL